VVRIVTVVACAAALALVPRAARADGPTLDAASDRRWRLSAVTVGFADDFLGFPRTRLNDDNGFVADLRVSGELTDGDRRTARIVASQQIITERGGLDRVDDGKIWLEWERAPASLSGMTLGWLAGLNVIGNLGGSKMQNWAHENLFTGRVLDGTGHGQLQYRYPQRTEVLAMAGGHVRTIHPLAGPLSIRGGMQAAVGAGTGFFAEVHPYVAVGVTLGFADLELREGASTYWTTIRALTMPGGYVTRLFQSQPSARLVLNGPPALPVIFGLELDWNSGNTRQHVGGIVVGARF
jgi:hypothetical protein